MNIVNTVNWIRQHHFIDLHLIKCKNMNKNMVTILLEESLNDQFHRSTSSTSRNMKQVCDYEGLWQHFLIFETFWQKCEDNIAQYRKTSLLAQVRPKHHWFSKRRPIQFFFWIITIAFLNFGRSIKATSRYIGTKLDLGAMLGLYITDFSKQTTSPFFLHI